MTEFNGQSFSAFKEVLTEALIATIAPIRTDIARYLSDRAVVDAVMRDGAHRAKTIATQVMRETQDLIGLLR